MKDVPTSPAAPHSSWHARSAGCHHWCGCHHGYHLHLKHTDESIYSVQQTDERSVCWVPVLAALQGAVDSNVKPLLSLSLTEPETRRRNELYRLWDGSLTEPGEAHINRSIRSAVFTGALHQFPLTEEGAADERANHISTHHDQTAHLKSSNHPHTVFWEVAIETLPGCSCRQGEEMSRAIPPPRHILSSQSLYSSFFSFAFCTDECTHAHTGLAIIIYSLVTLMRIIYANVMDDLIHVSKWLYCMCAILQLRWVPWLGTDQVRNSIQGLH